MLMIRLFQLWYSKLAFGSILDRIKAIMMEVFGFSSVSTGEYWDRTSNRPWLPLSRYLQFMIIFWLYIISEVVRASLNNLINLIKIHVIITHSISVPVFQVDSLQDISKINSCMNLFPRSHSLSSIIIAFIWFIKRARVKIPLFRIIITFSFLLIYPDISLSVLFSVILF